MTWADQAAYLRMTEKFSQPDVLEKFAADEAVFLDRSKTILLSVGEFPAPPEGRAF
jgi:hypothetical protein